MDKKILILAAIGAAIGVGLGIWRSPERKAGAVQDLFPPEKLQGYVQGTKIMVVEAPQGRGQVIAWAIVPFGIQQGQVSPTGYGAIKALKSQYPKAEGISVFIAEDSAMARAANFVGLAELRGGAVHLSGGLPTQAQLDSLSAMGQPLSRPTPGDLRITAAVFDSTGGLASERWRLARTLMGGTVADKSRFADLDLETAVLGQVAKSVGKPLKSVQATVVGVTRYYWLRAGDPL